MLLEQLKELLAEQFGVEPDSIDEETSFESDLGAVTEDDFADLSLALEATFDVGSLADEDLSRFATVGELANFLLDRVEE